MSKTIPQPRTFTVYSKPHHLGETWIEGFCEGNRRARVRFPDGKLRVVTARGAADTYFSTPCKSHDGYITSQETQWNPEGEYVFRPHTKSQEKYGSW